MSIKDESLTPISLFLDKYDKEGKARFHMPGHKGRDVFALSFKDDITEVKGADYLYEASGIIGKSEGVASRLFESGKTVFSTEGSTLSIKTMAALAVRYYYQCGKSGTPVFVAPRNAHKAFVDALILTGADVRWVLPATEGGICTAFVTPDEIEAQIKGGEDVCAVYLTSPDYCGNLADIASISSVCKKYRLPLLVDNAHGAYLKFMGRGLHPLEQGADICCDSAHKTLPVLTGGGYLHIGNGAPEFFGENVKSVMSLFASTSPSYLILKSLDKANAALAQGYGERILKTEQALGRAAEILRQKGFDAKQNEPLKLCVRPNSCGYSGGEFADMLRENGIECEYADGGCVVLMASPYNREEDFLRLKAAFEIIKPTRKRVESEVIHLSGVKAAMTPKEAYFLPFERVDVNESAGRICAYSVTSCQPSIPVCVGGEIISDEMVKILKRYSILEINVLQ